jgi:predicted unusual protein kinase regulating ubiquinone biosynthesis (AarF/ABC1/UbiB family)
MKVLCIIILAMYRSRSLRILWFFGRAILRFIWWDILLSRIGFGWYARRTRARRMQREAAAYRKLAIRLGGVMIKVGQFLSTRVDVLPAYITAELSDLQDEVAAEKFADIQRVIEAEFGRPLREIFLDFDSQALAAASIGQAHNAHLHAAEGDVPIDVVVKVQRPHIEEIIQVDLAAFRIVARWFDKYPPIRKRADVPALTNEFSQSLLEEVDYLHEGKNAEIFAANFQKRPEIYVPKVYWEYTWKISTGSRSATMPRLRLPGWIARKQPNACWMPISNRLSRTVSFMPILIRGTYSLYLLRKILRLSVL